ncbi:MAG: hypothetical protein EHM23_27670 [Acidobacteria bacterium]|nr:MAG: hypothetical protein EHM23_27670 [Acidobacteriota bacterium]
MTFAELKTEVFRVLKENSTTPVYWSAQDVEDSLNEGLETISEASEFYETNTTVSLQANQTYYDLKDLAGDGFLRVTRVWNTQTSRWLAPTDVRKLDGAYRQWEKNTGEPQKWFVRGLWHLGVWPKADATSGTVKVYHRSLPAALSATTDTPAFQREFHQGLVRYAAYDLLAQDGETRKALTQYEQYLGFENRLKAYVGGRISVDRIGGFRG